jgi:hypothetical protein
LCVPGVACLPDAPGANPLSDRTYDQLTLCDGQPALHRIALPAGQGRSVELRYDPAAGPVALTATLNQTPLARSAHGLGRELIVLAPAPEGRDIELHVEGQRAGLNTTYSLRLDTLAADACPPDRHEGLLGNDDAAHATPTRPGQLALGLCPGDHDWFALELPAGTLLNLTVLAPELDGLGLTIHGPNGDPLTQGVLGELPPDPQLGGPPTPALLASHTTHAAGRYTVHLSGQAPALTLTVTTQRAEDAPALACAAARQLQPGQPMTLQGNTLVQRLGLGCGFGQSGDYVAWFDLEEPALIRLNATAGDADVGLALRQDCADPASERHCQFAVDAQLEAELDAGRWYVIALPNGPRAELTLEISPNCQGDAECDGEQICHQGRCSAPCEGDYACPGLCDAGRCIDPECATHGDCPADCVDGRCLGEIPADCGAERPCPGEQTCAPSLLCAPVEACEDDLGCPAGLARCNATDGLCFACLSDEDCGLAEACSDGRCHWTGRCDAEHPCPEGQACDQQGQCAVSAECVGDRYDDGDRQAGAPPHLELRAYTHLRRCADTEDRYRITVPADQGLTVTARHDPSEGDLRLALITGQAQDAVIERSDGALGFERLGIAPAPFERSVELQLTGHPGGDPFYSLDLRASQGCPPDALEGPFGNDTPATATRITRPDALRLCPGESDWLALDLVTGSRARFEAFNNIDLVVHSPDGQELTRAGGQADGSHVEFDALRAGRYRIQLSSASPQPVHTAFDFSLSPTEGAAQLACDQAPTVDLAGHATLSANLGVERFGTGCGLPMGADRIVRFDLAQAGPVRVTALDAPSDNTALSIRSGCTVDTELACDLNAVEANLAAGSYFVVIKSAQGLPLSVHVER